MRNLKILILALCFFCPALYSSPVPEGNANDHQAIDDVKELEKLRTENYKSNNNKSETSGVSQVETKLPQTALNNNNVDAEPQSNSRSAIFRHRGITQAKKSSYWNEEVQQPEIDAYTKYAGIQYSPADLATYVFNTGDEEGVAVAVEELVREGMMGRTDAINYLQDVKQVLNYMRDQYERRKQMEGVKNGAYPKPEVTQRFPNPLREQYVSQLITDKRDSKPVEVAPSPAVTTDHPHQSVIASTSEPPQLASTTAHAKNEEQARIQYKEEDFKRHGSPKQNYDFTLDVIYKLAKDMFTQSILRDDPTAEETLSSLVTYLESEVGNNRISPTMKEKVLEAVSAALVDSLREYQGLLSENQAQNFDEMGLSQHLANRPSLAKVPTLEMYRKLGVKGPESMLQLSANNNRPKSS